MKNSKFIKNTFLLVLGGLIVKVLGFVIKIFYTRILKDEGVALISLVSPTYSLLLTITSFSLPYAISKLIACKAERKSKIIFSSLYITFFINLIIIVLIFLLSNYISLYLLHDKRCTYLIKILCLTLPFVSVTSIIKAYFYGIENVIPVIFSNISEEILKLSLILIFLPKIMIKGVFYGTCFYLIINLLCEFISFFTLSIFLPKKIKFKNICYRFDNMLTFNILKICLPTFSGRLIGCIGFFIEPIILTNLLIYKGFESSYIILNYGYYQGYVIALLTIPSFFLSALSNNIIPEISKRKNNCRKDIFKLIFKILFFVLICGCIFTIILFIFGEKIMFLLFNSTNGLLYLKILLPFFILFYLENPLSSILLALDQEKNIFKVTLYGLIIKYLSLILLILFNTGFISLIISEIINILFVIFLLIFYLYKYYLNHFS